MLTQRVQNRRKKARIIGSLRWLMPFLTAILAVVAGYYFIQSPFFYVSSIKVQGTRTLDQYEITQLSGINKGENIFKIDIRQAKTNILMNSMVDEVIIRRNFPRTVIIEITERTPVAVIPIENGFLQVDGRAYSLRKKEALEVELVLPVITGVNIPSTIAMGERIADPALEMGLKMVMQMDQGAKQVLGEIDVTDPQKIRAFTVDGAEIRFGDANDFQQKFTTFLQIIQQQQKNKKINDILYIDVSFVGKPVVRYRN